MQTRICFSALSVLLLAVPSVLHAQQGEIPPVADENALALIDSTAGSDRIVEGRPRLYPVKRAGHPISWIESGMHPILRLVEKAAGSKIGSPDKRPPATSGVKFGVKGLGASTGFGPEIKPFHRDLFNKGIEVELPMVVTYRMYEAFRFRASRPFRPWVIDGLMPQINLELTAGYFSRPSDSFFGIGNETPRTETRFRTVTRSAALGAESHLRGSAWSLRGTMGPRSVGVTEPKDFRSAFDTFSPQDVPGIRDGVVMLQTTAALQRNTTDHPHLASSGSAQLFEASLNEAQRGGDFSYWHYRVDLQQFIPLSQDHRKVLSLRTELETNRPKGGSNVPFFDLPTIGSMSTVRGYATRRFADRSAMNASIEYRYRIWRYVDFSLFSDTGQVAPEIGNFAWDNMHTSYGGGFIFRSQGGHGVITNVTRSREGWGLYIDFSPLF